MERQKKIPKTKIPLIRDETWFQGKKAKLQRKSAKPERELMKVQRDGGEKKGMLPTLRSKAHVFSRV